MREALSARRRCAAGLAIAAFLGGASNASAQWAPAASATVHPGVMTFTDGAQCTANFVFFDGANNVYIGQAAWIEPILHRAATMSLSTIGITTRRAGHDALVSRDLSCAWT